MESLDGKRVFFEEAPTISPQHHNTSFKRLRLDDLLNQPEQPQEDYSLDALQSSDRFDVTYNDNETGTTLQDSQNEDLDGEDNTAEDQATSTSDNLSIDESPLSSAEISSQICLGMITNVRVRFLDGQQRSRLRSNINGLFSVVELEFADGRCNLTLAHSDAKAVALLNKKDFKWLNELVDTYELHCHGVFTFQQLEQTDDSLIIAVAINLYCAEDRVDEALAFAIFKAGYFLQDPTWIPEGIQYRNPQFFELPGSDIAVLNEDEVISGGQSNPQNPSNRSSKYVKSYGLDFDGILDDFARHERLSQTTVDHRIRTKLLNYQREGLDFILKRESDTATDESSLWKLESRNAEETVYRHRITGATSPFPKEMIGGILADEMGLGKSLTMLSAVVASLGDAWSYAQTNTSIDMFGDKSIIAAKSTLLVVPSALLIDNWIAEIETHIQPGCLTYYKYHGHRRSIQWTELLKYDLILTTYGTIAAEANRIEKVLSKYHWYRVVLDEAHIVRNCSTHKFRATRSLRSLIRWCLTGTPIQNTIEDLGSLVRFLRMPILEENAQFRRHITNEVQPTKDNPNPDFRNLHALLSAICLRRNKSVLPNSTSSETTCDIDFTHREQEEYDRIGKLCLQALNMAVSGHISTQSHAGVLEAILKLRLFCNNGKLNDVLWTQSVLVDVEEDFALAQQNNAAICHYCGDDIISVGSHDDPESAKITRCHKLICVECLDTYRQNLKKGLCPICNHKHNVLASTANPPTTIGRQHAMGTPQGHIFPTKLLKLCENIKSQDRSDKRFDRLRMQARC